MEILSIQKNIHTSSRKLRLVADMVRKMKPEQSLTVLRFADQAAADPLSKAIKTALANAKEQGLNGSEMVFKSLEINGATQMRRMRPGSRGRSKPYSKRMSHIKVVLSNEMPTKEKKTMKKETVKVEEPVEKNEVKEEK
jgi:large subunit ribosomal protein L22